MRRSSTLLGEFDLDARDRLTEALRVASVARDRLVIDLSRTTFIDSTGIKALADVWRSRVDAGREVVLREPTPAVMRTLKMAGLADLLPIDPTSHPVSARSRTKAVSSFRPEITRQWAGPSAGLSSCRRHWATTGTRNEVCVSDPDFSTFS
jgi:anti-anti-sigma factor